MTTQIRDVIAAEEALEATEAELRTFTNDPRQWGAYESMDRQGKLSLNIMPAHYERRDALTGG